jgi:hypothetical protein
VFFAGFHANVLLRFIANRIAVRRLFLIYHILQANATGKYLHGIFLFRPGTQRHFQHNITTKTGFN